MFGRKKTAVYLGDIRIAARSFGKRAADFEFFDSADIDSAISAKISDAVALPLERGADTLPDSHFAIDFIVTDFTQGTSDSLWSSELAVIGLLYRPKVVIASRLRDGKNGEVKYQTQTAKRMSLLAYLAESIDLRSTFRSSIRDDETFDRLLLECLLENMRKIQAHIR